MKFPAYPPSEWCRNAAVGDTVTLSGHDVSCGTALYKRFGISVETSRAWLVTTNTNPPIAVSLVTVLGKEINHDHISQ